MYGAITSANMCEPIAIELTEEEHALLVSVAHEQCLNVDTLIQNATRALTAVPRQVTLLEQAS